MTEALVEAGACGFKVAIRVEKEKEGLLDGTSKLTVSSACPDVMAMAKALNGSRPNTDFMGGLTKNAVFAEAAKHIRCSDCPVPAAILKTANVEMGIALPKDLVIKFRKDSGRPGPTV